MMTKPTKKPQGGMSVREAGRKGGQTVKARYGSEFYESIGRKGGEARGRKQGRGNGSAARENGSAAESNGNDGARFGPPNPLDVINEI